jgi:pimeloyl-ACP methyl ester carboxylesterase
MEMLELAHPKPHVIFLPGMLCDAGYWQHQVESLSDLCTASVARYPFADSISAMAKTTLTRAPSSFILVGHSMGGRVALELIKRVPQRVVGLAIFGSDYRGHSDRASFLAEKSAYEGAIALAKKEGFPAYARRWARKVLPEQRWGDEALVVEVEEMALRQGLQCLEAHCSAGLNRTDYTETLARIRCPVLICSGSEDTLRDSDTHRLMASQIARSEFLEIHGAGHMMAIEAPHDVSKLLRDWILDVIQSKAQR